MWKVKVKLVCNQENFILLGSSSKQAKIKKKNFQLKIVFYLKVNEKIPWNQCGDVAHQKQTYFHSHFLRLKKYAVKFSFESKCNANLKFLFATARLAVIYARFSRYFFHKPNAFCVLM